jgi:hypothetical protein
MLRDPHRTIATLPNLLEVTMTKRRSLVLVLATILAIALPASVMAESKPAVRLGASASSAAFDCTPAQPMNVRATATPAGNTVRIATATATVHWTTGDQTYPMARGVGSNANAMLAKIPVPDGQALGVVWVDVSAVVGSATLTATVKSRIVACDILP